MKATILTLFALSAFAQAPKTIPTLSTAERIALASVVAESKTLGERQKALQEQFATIRREACQQHYKADSCEIKDDGSIVLIAPPEKKEAKK